MRSKCFYAVVLIIKKKKNEPNPLIKKKEIDSNPLIEKKEISLSIFESAHQEDLKFPCIDKGCKFSVQHRSDSCGRPSNPKQIEVSTFLYDYGVESVKCFLTGFNSFLESMNDENSTVFDFK